MHGSMQRSFLYLSRVITSQLQTITLCLYYQHYERCVETLSFFNLQTIYLKTITKVATDQTIPETLNIFTTDTFLHAMDQQKLSTLVLVDLSKVFDSPNHTILLPKLMSSARVYCRNLKYLHKRDNDENIYLAHGKIWVYYSFVAVTSTTKTKSRHNNSNQPVVFL